MSYSAKIIADSISPAGIRLTTLEVTFPRFILAEFNTHRALSRNSASSRAVPVSKRIDQIVANPFVPEQFGSKKKGMQAGDPLTDSADAASREHWIAALRAAVEHASMLDGIGVHKQLANRLLEPFAWHTAVVTATEWSNFFHLRCHPDAQPEFQKIATLMRDTMDEHDPEKVASGQWHLPYITEEDKAELIYNKKYAAENQPDLWELLARASAARCARVSYLTHEGKRDLDADWVLAGRLLAAGHMSPFEHPARPLYHGITNYRGNFRGWLQYRKTIPNEHDPLGQTLSTRTEADTTETERR